MIVPFLRVPEIRTNPSFIEMQHTNCFSLLGDGVLLSVTARHGSRVLRGTSMKTSYSYMWSCDSGAVLMQQAIYDAISLHNRKTLRHLDDLVNVALTQLLVNG